MLSEAQLDEQNFLDLHFRSEDESGIKNSANTDSKGTPSNVLIEDASIENTDSLLKEVCDHPYKTELIAIQDRTYKNIQEDVFFINESRYKMLYDDTPSIAFTLTSDKKIYSISRFGAKRLGYCTDDLLGRSITELESEVDSTRMENIYQECLRKPYDIHQWETTRHCMNGNCISVWETARITRDINGNQYILIACQEITEPQIVVDEEMSNLAGNNMTGLINRQMLEQHINKLMDTDQGEGSEHALCYLDLDQFKVINDTYGHIAGDNFLKEIAEILKQCVRKHDIVARLGGDDFAILIKNCTLEEVRHIASIILRTISAHNFIWQGQTLKLGASIGLVPIYLQDRNATQLLSAADSACNLAKEQGRDRIHIFRENDPEQAQRHEEMQWVARINQALKDDRFRLYYQVITPVNAETRGNHFELLLRMVDDDGKIIPPSSFLPAAERYGLITKLDRWVIRNAIAWLSSDIERIRYLHCASINLSGYSIEDEEFLEFLIHEISNSAVPASKICLELTETTAIAYISTAAESIQRLKDLGCLIAIDDFGTGFSSFAYLKNLPIDILKIDGMFVKDILTDPTDLALVKSINEISHVMGKQTVAEFVETPEILEKLQEIGVDYAQGYAIGHPTPIQNTPRRI